MVFVVAFLRFSLFRALEERHEALNACPGVLWAVSGSASAGTSWATFVDHVFGFVMEMRSCCAECGGDVQQSFEAARVLVLPISEDDSTAAVTTTELYMRLCAPKVVETAGAVACERCGKRSRLICWSR